MTIRGNRTVGIGTTSPASILHLRDAVPILRLEDTVSNSTATIVNINTHIGSTPTLTLGFPVNEGTNRAVNFRMNGTDIMTIFGNGRVGIGTTAPGYKLTIGGSGDVFAIDNAASFIARNSGGTYEPYLWPRWADNIMYLNYGSGGFNIRNNSSVSTMFMTSSGRVGIGTTSPASILHLRDAVPILRLEDTVSNSTATITNINTHIGSTPTLTLGFPVNEGTNRAVNFRMNGTDIMTIRGNGNVGIGTTEPGYRLHVAGTVAANGFQNLSDQRWKTNIKPIQNALDNVLKMQGVTYYWKVDEYPDKHFPEGEQVGFIAQEIEKVYPQVVLADKDGYKSVDYSKLTPVLVEAIKEQQKIIEGLQKTVAQQQQLIDLQNQKIAQLEQKLEELANKLGS